MSNSNNDLETTTIATNPAPRKRGRPRKTEAEKLEARQNKIQERLQKALEKKQQRLSTIEAPFKTTVTTNLQTLESTSDYNSDIHQRTKHTIDNLVHPHTAEPTAAPASDRPKLTLRFKDGRSISASNRTEVTANNLRTSATSATSTTSVSDSLKTTEATSVEPASPSANSLSLTPASEDLASSEAAPRRRGRPRKVRPENEPPKPKGRPGRPRKVRPEEMAANEATKDAESTETAVKVESSFASSHENSPNYLTKEHFDKPTKPILPKKRLLDLDDDEDEDDDDLDLISGLDDDTDDTDDYIDDDLSEFINDKNDLKNQQLQSINVEKIIVPFNPRRFTRIETSINQKTYSSTSSSLEAIGIKPYVFDGEEEYMNDRQLKHIRAILLTQRATLIKQLEETRETMRENNENFADELDQASVESDYAISLRIRDRERKLTLKIDRALARLNNDPDFGYCEKCGEEIGLRRLEARPTADLCINCKTKAEIHERQQKG